MHLLFALCGQRDASGPLMVAIRAAGAHPLPYHARTPDLDPELAVALSAQSCCRAPESHLVLLQSVWIQS